MAVIDRIRVLRIFLVAGSLTPLAACGFDSAPALSGRSEEPFEWPDHLSPLPLEPPPFILGSTAPDFALPVLTVEGVGPDTVRLSDLRGHIVVLNFWSVGCAPCVAEHEPVNRVAEKYADEGVRYLGITGESPERLAGFEKDHGPTSYPHLQKNQGVSQNYRQKAFPLHVVIDPDGRVAWWRPGGPIAEETLTDVIEDILAGRRPDAYTTAAYTDSALTR